VEGRRRAVRQRLQALCLLLHSAPQQGAPHWPPAVCQLLASRRHPLPPEPCFSVLLSASPASRDQSSAQALSALGSRDRLGQPSTCFTAPFSRRLPPPVSVVAEDLAALFAAEPEMVSELISLVQVSWGCGLGAVLILAPDSRRLHTCPGFQATDSASMGVLLRLNTNPACSLTQGHPSVADPLDLPPCALPPFTARGGCPWGPARAGAAHADGAAL
jgi:hypothetical protein